jgi:hypothetical protein
VAVELFVLFLVAGDMIGRSYLMGWKRYTRTIVNWVDCAALLVYTITLCLALAHLDQNKRVAELEGIIGELVMICRNSWHVFKLKRTLDTIDASITLMKMVDYNNYEISPQASGSTPTFRDEIRD